MGLSSLNSLLEVGVGLNLAFTLISDIRRWIRDGFRGFWEGRIKLVNAAVAEVADASPKLKNFVEKIESAKRKYERYSLLYMRISIVIAALVSAVLLVLLTIAAADGENSQVHPKLAWIILIVIAFPLTFATITQAALLGGYMCLIKWETRGLDNIREIIRAAQQSIGPTKPTP